MKYFKGKKHVFYISKQEAQLPQRNSASAAHMDGELSPPAPTSPSGYTYNYETSESKTAIAKTEFYVK